MPLHYQIEFNTNILSLSLINPVVPKEDIYIVGDGLEKPWELVGSNQLTHISGTLYTIESIHMNADVKFKFATKDWAKEYVRDENASSYYTAILKTGSMGDVRFVPSAQNSSFKAGTYNVSLDIASGVVTLSLQREDGVLEKLYIFGPATEAAWDTSKFIELPTISNNVFQREHISLDFGGSADDPKGNGFKFSETRGWNRQWGAKENYENGYRGWELGELSSDALQFYPLLNGLSSGLYTVKVDLNNRTITLIAE